jgi:hypothetical protein
MARDLYHHLRPLCGRQDYEVTRRGRSSGIVSPKSDSDLLDCCHYVSGLFPRKLRGVLILRGFLEYHMVYRNVSSSRFVHLAYSPPKEGGSFKMPSKLLLQYPLLVEFAYLKMMAVEILYSLNTHCASMGLSEVAKGVYACEALKLNLAWDKYKNFNLPGEGEMFAFLECFNTSHTFLMVCYPVGMHNDHFKHSDKSLENKILLLIDSKKLSGTVGRGGCIMGTHYMYALLDW